MAYNPVTDGDPDPGEIVWTWVPFEEADGRGKDRPVLVVAAGPGGQGDGTVLAVPLTSKSHDGADHVPIGTGAWDAQRRPSWADVSRVLRVTPAGMRREACALGREPYDRVAQRLRQRYGWR
ncbi:type II toxin-antitoxin system PemK/MazF family toxin [Nakamurella sp. YIM 132084]|uniref:Type II toxin-antitoxin system PemK/MazF family toxin n=2 Tax=Nakamurella leprariae TaxID=2803911 RepID=A0A939C244_9ACTN|nr:type II toxin-antitoxin system PemK/MazF family toxin [Nakamurella leprariae]